jgi:ABC-2 type transport system ATP-binding protein
LINVEKLSKRYGTFIALDSISFSVKKGDVLGFIGPNGAGKTTTMRVLTTFLPPSEGMVSVGGFNVLEDSWNVRKLVGYLPESPPLYPELTIGRYLRFVAEIRSVENISVTVGKVMERVGLSGWENRIISSLSKGYRQRVGLAQAIIHDPKVLILDEPTSGLDPTQVVGIRQFISELAEDRTVILSTHVLSEVEKLCNRGLIIDKGTIRAEGTLDELRSLAGGKRFQLEIQSQEDPQKILSELDGVTSLQTKNRTENVFHIEIFSEQELRERIADIARKRNWAIRTLNLRQPSIEEVFLRVIGEEE